MDVNAVVLLAGEPKHKTAQMRFALMNFHFSSRGLSCPEMGVLAGGGALAGPPVGAGVVPGAGKALSSLLA